VAAPDRRRAVAGAGDGFVDAAIEVDVRARAPDPLPQLLLRDDVAGRRHEHRQDLKRLLREV
jgi:hypothetical protein